MVDGSDNLRSEDANLIWVEAVPPEVEAHLVAAERAILQALREFARQRKSKNATPCKETSLSVE